MRGSSAAAASARPSVASSASEDRGARRFADPGAIRNTLLQLMNNLTGVVFTGALTLFLVRALGTSGYGHYALAAGIASLLVLPAGLGLPMAVGRYLADHRTDVEQLRAVFRLGMKLQLPAALLATVALFAAAAPVAAAYGDPHLAWPLRFMALSVFGQAMFAFLSYAGASLRQSAVGFRMAVAESATETSTSIVLVVLGAGATGAAFGKAIGFAVATAAGLYLVLRLVGSPRRRGGPHPTVGAREVLGYAGASLVVDLGVAAIAQVDILLIGALFTASAVGSFSAVMRIVAVLGYLGTAVAGGVAPRMSLANGSPDTETLQRAIRYLLVAQGVVLAPMLVWSGPIVRLLLGSGYESSAEIMQVLSVMAFVSAPAAVLSVSVTYLGGARRRVWIVLATLAIGVVCTYVLLVTVGVVGAAIADDFVAFAYVLANLWICTRLVTLDVRRLALSFARILIAAGAMTVALLAVGTDHLSPVQWLAGALVGAASYLAALVATGELDVAELRADAARLVPRARSSASPG